MDYFYHELNHKYTVIKNVQYYYQGKDSKVSGREYIVQNQTQRYQKDCHDDDER